MPTGTEVPQYKTINRNQMFWDSIDCEDLIPAQHVARAIWAMRGRLDLSEFEQDIRSFEGAGGRPCWPARLLVSVLVYAYSEGVSAVRRMERMAERDPGMRWLCGGEQVNYHTLAEFRMQKQERLEKLLQELLAQLQQEELIDLELVTQDGTKVRAVASTQSMRRRKTLEEHREQAREALRKLQAEGEPEKGPAAQGQPGANQALTVAEAARLRAAREKVARLEAAMTEWEQRAQQRTEAEQGRLRISESEPEARKMKQTDGGFAPSYNVQSSTDGKHKIVLAVAVTQDHADIGQLQPALPRIVSYAGGKPRRMVTDGGYASRANVRAMSEQGVEFLAPWKEDSAREAGALKRQGIDAEFGAAAFPRVAEQDVLRCPAGKLLLLVQQHRHHGEDCQIYQAAAQDCAACAFQSRCCGRPAQRQQHRVLEGPAMQAYLERMQQAPAQALYKRRKAVAETPHLWWKANFGWRQFSVRGLARATKEMLWVAITYNIRQWARLKWAPQPVEV